MKKNMFFAIGLAACACAHSAPPPQEGQLLDDAALQKFRDDPAAGPPQRSMGVTTLGQGEVDLSRWKSSEERAAASGDGSQGEAGAAAASSPTSDFAGGGDNLGTQPMSPEDGAGDEIADDAGGRVEEDPVELVSPDE